MHSTHAAKGFCVPPSDGTDFFRWLLRCTLQPKRKIGLSPGMASKLMRQVAAKHCSYLTKLCLCSFVAIPVTHPAIAIPSVRAVPVSDGKAVSRHTKPEHSIATSTHCPFFCRHLLGRPQLRLCHGLCEQTHRPRKQSPHQSLA